MAMRDVTELMWTYRECSRHLWNTYFSGRQDIGASLDVFEQIRDLLFDSLVLSELAYERDAAAAAACAPDLRVVPRASSVILIRRSGEAAEAGYWDEERDLTVGPEDVSLAFVDYFDFSQVPVKDFHFYLCKVRSFPARRAYDGREALLAVTDARVFHKEPL